MYYRKEDLPMISIEWIFINLCTLTYISLAVFMVFIVWLVLELFIGDR